MHSRKLDELSKKMSGPIPFWFLNGHVDEWQIVREFQMMHEKGVGGVIVHPRYGLEVDYLSDDWFEIFGWCVREARKHGMHIWIYDELNWPSGTAGMSVMKMNPDYRSKYLAVERTPVDEIDFGNFQPGDYMVAANMEVDIVTKTRLVEDADTAKALGSNWHLFNCTVKYDEFYVDTLSKEAIDCFKRVTYDEYYRRFGDEFGKTIQASFTDEPSIYWVSVGYDDWNLPYTQDFFDTFEQINGYSPVPMIPYLFYPGREGTAFRAEFWKHAGRLFNERYHANLGDWCREHGIIYTGHNNHEEPLRYQIRYQGDMFGTMHQMDVPGVDHLGKQTLGNSWISIIGHKICSSAAHIAGKSRCMSESFGTMGWDTTFTNLKRVTDWQFGLGINMIIPHAIYHTISGMTKRECPPSFFYQSPHWDDFEYFISYLEHLEEMLVGGRHVCRVAVMYPSHGLWASYQSDQKTPDFEHTDNFLDSLCLELIKNQIDFDLLDHEALADAELDGGQIKLADEAYDFLIVPATPYMRSTEVDRLREIAESGVNCTFFHKAMEPLEHNLPDGLRAATFVRTEELGTYCGILKKELDDDLQLVGGGVDEVLAYRREKDGRKITFLVNRSEKHRKVTVRLKDYPDAAVFDPDTGEYTRLQSRQTGPKTQAQLRFQPNQSCFLVSGHADAAPAKNLHGEPTPIEIQNMTVEAPFNTASLYRFDYTKAKDATGGAPESVDVRTYPRFIPCNWDPNKPDFTEWAGVYEAELDIDVPAEGMKLVLDKDFADCEVYVNDTLVELTPCCQNGAGNRQECTSDEFFLTDFQDIQATICHLLRQGANRFKVVSPTKLSEPLRIVGNFRVQIQGEKLALLEPGEVNMFRLETHYPFYSGTVVYRCEFEAETDYAGLVLNLHDVRDSAEVTVNGKPAGKRLWAPYQFDIAEQSKPGKNTLEIAVRNNMTNLIYGNPRSLGLQNMPTLAGFEA